MTAVVSVVVWCGDSCGVILIVVVVEGPAVKHVLSPMSGRNGK